MITIYPENEEVEAYIGKQEFSPWETYRRSIYTYSLEVEEGTLLYNLMTREIVLLSGDVSMPRLVHSWFYVPESIDERSLMYGFWQKYYTRHPLRKMPLKSAVIFTTTECNAHCPYCYEKGTSINRMTLETAEKVAKYLIKESSDTIHLKWFGGEPLMNTEVIDLICNRLIDAGREYNSSITTNAYLLDRVTDGTILDLWKLKDIQITIDGTKTEYERIKGLCEGAYEKVISTIERLAKLGIKVIIRVHITKDNGDDIKELVKELDKRLSGIGNIHLYAVPIFEMMDPVTDDERKKIYDDLIEIDKLIAKTGISRGWGIPGIRGAHCMADNRCSISIAPTGDFTPCEHYHDAEICGNVVDGGDIPEKWFKRTPEIPECKNCFYYPQCCKLDLCNAEPPCDEQNRRYMKHTTELSMLSAYKYYRETGRAPDNAQRPRNSAERGRNKRERLHC